MLPGDVYDTGAVNSKDLTGIGNEWHGKRGAKSTIFGDILGDGTVSASDYKAARKFVGTKLPKLSVKKMKVLVARAIVYQHGRMSLHGDRTGSL